MSDSSQGGPTKEEYLRVFSNGSKKWKQIKVELHSVPWRDIARFQLFNGYIAGRHAFKAQPSPALMPLKITKALPKLQRVEVSQTLFFETTCCKTWKDVLQICF